MATLDWDLSIAGAASCHLSSFRVLDKKEFLMIIRYNFLLILHKNICCDPSAELSHQ